MNENVRFYVLSVPGLGFLLASLLVPNRSVSKHTCQLRTSFALVPLIDFTPLFPSIRESEMLSRNWNFG